MEKNKLALFDLDGTLFNTNKVNYLSYKQALNEEGYDLEYEYFAKECNGKLYKEFLPKIIETDDEELLQKLHKRKKELYSTNLGQALANLHLFNIAKSLKEDYYLAVVTTASKKNTFDILDFYNKTELFDLVLTHDDVINVKPDPEGYIKAMKSFNIDPKDTIIFEDSPSGIEAAVKSGANVFVVNNFI
jgi:beta-phosphoglucomutase